MTRRPYKNSSTSEEDAAGAKSAAHCNGFITKRHLSTEDLKVQCNGLSNTLRSSKLLSPSGSDVLPLPTQRRSTRRSSASWCGSTRELSQLSPVSPPISPADSELGVTLRPKGTLWLPVALIGTTAEEHGNNIRRRGDSDASLSSLETKPRRKKLSPEEKLLQDNKEYFKMEVLQTKLRSSRTSYIRTSSRLVNGRCARSVDAVDVESLIHVNKIMQKNGIKPKRTRRSELMKLCDEAESFMFGESSRQSAATHEGSEDERQESGDEERPKKKRRSHTEAFLHDNIDYYKFEKPESRLRNQSTSEDTPVAFSFEAVPDTEPWYDVFKRQDEGKETLFPTISDPANQLFLLPYELPRTAPRSELQDYYAKRRLRLKNILTASLPRKSPRCHASTLAILSSLKKRKRRSSGAPEGESPQQNDFLGSLDDDIEPITLLDPVEEATTRKKKTEELVLTAASVIPISQGSTEVLDLLAGYLSENEHAVKSRGRKRKCRVNRTGWAKARVKKGKGASVNTGIEPENIVDSPRRPMDSPTTTPCSVRVRKLSSNCCRKLSLSRRRRRSRSNRLWATHRRR